MGDISSAPTSWECSVGTQLAEMTPEKMQVAWEGSAITTRRGTDRPGGRDRLRSAHGVVHAAPPRGAVPAAQRQDPRVPVLQGAADAAGVLGHARQDGRADLDPGAVPRSRGHDHHGPVQAVLHHPRPEHGGVAVRRQNQLHFADSRDTQSGLVHRSGTQTSTHMACNRANIFTEPSRLTLSAAFVYLGA
jgi:hypothetical protein